MAPLKIKLELSKNQATKNQVGAIKNQVGATKNLEPPKITLKPPKLSHHKSFWSHQKLATKIQIGATKHEGTKIQFGALKNEACVQATKNQVEATKISRDTKNQVGATKNQGGAIIKKPPKIKVPKIKATLSQRISYLAPLFGHALPPTLPFLLRLCALGALHVN